MAFNLLTKINQLSKREKNIVGMLLLIIASMPFFYMTVPSWNQYMDSTSKISQSKNKLFEIENQTRKLEKIKGENQKLSQKIDDQKLYLAKTYEIDFLVQDLKKICDESSISLDSFTPSDPEPMNIILEKQLQSDVSGGSKTIKLKQVLDKLKGQDLPVDLYRYPIEVRVTGNFTDILELFKKLEKYGRVISIDNISIGKTGTKQGFDSRISKAKSKKQGNEGELIGAFDLAAYTLPLREENISLNQLQKNTRNTAFSYTRKRAK
ncbi:MAG: hypothetical protein A3I68_02145 [Candidatus Melainabacteria bacterium RIFCSPLOWO2_02_FULL_35_15]|nr:MAG: hypothetical protein A3F80_03590 [Candidatus Melainabacteria bacterium RIFCSPLOWO2_12_FULL_35_11]OGI13211.1 MAG: hypothetical protein A3I68_02145 [Candidatus Melainabacteria bacterium RIFCSPLOWO2_02_FULL_35_15]